MAPPAPLGIEPPRWRRAAKGPALASVLAAAAFLLSPRDGLAYPTSILAVPTGDAMSFGTINVAGALNFRTAPPPVDFSSGWIGLDFGTVPSVELTSSPLGDIAIGPIEGGFDVYGPSDDGRTAFVFNLKVQFLQETDYLPAFSVGFLQLSPDPNNNTALGYFAFTKAFSIRGFPLGDVTFGMMAGFGNGSLLAPGCITSSAPYCLFRGAAPYEDQNAGLLLAYRSPWAGPLAFAVDHIGGTSALSGTNVGLMAELVPESLYVASGVWFSNDRRDSPSGPPILDGFFLSASFYTSVQSIFRLDDKPLKSPKSSSGPDDDPDPAPDAPHDEGEPGSP